jgi:hypothetical protein
MWDYAMNIDSRPWILKEIAAEELRGKATPEQVAWLEAHAREWLDALVYFKREVETQIMEQDSRLDLERGSEGYDELRRAHLRWKRGARRILTLCEGRLVYAKRRATAQHQATQDEALGARLRRVEERLGLEP